jgi:hypothetical protein
VRDVAAPKLSHWGSRDQSHGTRESAVAHLDKEAISEAEGHVTMSELSLAKRRGPRSRDTWRRRRPHLYEGVVRSYNVCGSAWMHVLLIILTYSLYV